LKNFQTEEDAALGKEIDGKVASNKALALTMTNDQLDAELPEVEKRVAQKVSCPKRE
jgi:hypothetical protein